MKQVSMRVASLTLDEINPRHAKQTSSVEESIAALLEKGPDKLLKLARDIMQHGINPTELVVVMSEGDRNIVLEGNRRIAALKLLHKPTLAPTEQLQKKFAAIAKSGEAPKKVQCIIAESRLQAAHWIRLRHTGENNGIGVVRWSTSEASRFGGRSTPTEKARLFIEAISNLYADDSELLANVAAVRDSRITTLGRMIGDPDVRSRLGITFEEDVVLCSYPKHKMKPITSQLFDDLAGSLSVDRIKSKRQREDYLREVEDKLPKLADRLEEPEKFSRVTNGEAKSDLSNSNTADDANKKPPRRKRADFEKRLFQSVTLRHVTLRTSELLEEAKRLSIDEMPNVAAIMVRIVVDVVVTDAAEQLGWKRNQGDLKSRIGAVLNQVDPTKDDPSLSDAWRFSQKEEGALVLKTLHSFIHSWQSNPLTSEVRKLSMAYSPLLIKADELIAKKKR
ncbi:hypothetical protein GCM10019016_056520 [Streptomyces prasinosporus]|uniref:ParB/Sulfiredoxin domain-containing protein n=1 Tax=Streptomyces prasinosporus TaxID=68256 RepID=A0ABP6TV22_9ACTN